MNPPPQNPIPEIFVLWHPHCALGETLARRIHGWLRPGNGLGPQVFYRSLPAPEAPPGGLPPPLPGETRGVAPTGPGPRVSNFQIVLPLIDEHMIADPAWRHWLSQISSPTASPEPREFLPVALDTTAYNAPAPLRERNFLRPTGLPLANVGAKAGDPALEAVVRSLLKQLTEAMCRLLLGQARSAAAPAPATELAAPKIKVFLSHAKADGMAPARRIRDYIYSQTQLAAFYDENDIPFGSVFSRVLQNDVQGEDTAALIAVRSARYASRPWCRRELFLFRRPLPETPDEMTAMRWRLNPTLVVDALESGASMPGISGAGNSSISARTVGIPELGNSPIIRWDEKVPEQEEEIVTTLLRDAMLAAFHSAVGRTVPDATNRIILNWLPDPTTLLQIPRVRNENGDLEVLYPGRSLSFLELGILGEFFPQLQFRSFEEVLL